MLPPLTPPSHPYQQARPLSTERPNLGLVGVEFDGTSCFRRGSLLAPDAIREASPHLETYSPSLEKDLEDLCFYDLGNIPMDRSRGPYELWNHATESIFALFRTFEDLRLVTLGGEHSVSYAPIVHYLQKFSHLVLLHLDAHADLREEYQGYSFGHASIMRRVLDHFGENHLLIQYGIRSATKEEHRWLKEHKTLRGDRESFLKKVREIPCNRPIYLTLDLDYFDPAFFPGTGTPEPGGEDFTSFLDLIKILNTKTFVGADVVELCPPVDPTGNSSVFASKVVREILLGLS